MKKPLLLVCAVSACVLAACCLATAADWPQFRHDVGRTAASPESLPTDLHLQWTRELPTPRPAFPGELRLRYDATYEPVVAGKTMFVPSMVTDTVTALDTETGKHRWVFFAEGPVRFAPAVWEGKVYFVSDDGYLYCVNAADGKLLWKFRDLPTEMTERMVMGNGRLVSLCPARGGPVLADGVVYFGAGIWCGEGVAVYALDAKTGKVIWSNTDSGQIEAANMDHGVSYYAGISPQGYLAIVDGKLVVPCGAQLPAILDLKTGETAPYTMGWGGRVGLAKGCWFVAGVRNYLTHAGDLYDIQRPSEGQLRQGAKPWENMLFAGGLVRLQVDRTNQKYLGQFRQPVLTSDAMYYSDKGIVAYDLAEGEVKERKAPGNPTYRAKDQYPDKLRVEFPELWRLESVSKVHIKAGSRLYCGRQNVAEAVSIPGSGEEPAVSWQAEVEGTPHSMAAADGKLFVATREGWLYAFGEEKQAEPLSHPALSFNFPKQDDWTKKAADILAASRTKDGYALVVGLGSGRLAEELARQSQCHVIVIDPDAKKVGNLRRKFHEDGLYGTRVTILVGDPTSYPFPPYFASLIVSEDPAVLGEDPGELFADRLVHCLRPYGGTACLGLPDNERRQFVATVAGRKLAGVHAREAGDFALVKREVRLPESAEWSHGAATAANTGASEDRAVKPPLARLWFDGSLRWIRTPGASIVRITGGRMFVHNGTLTAIDVYTGRIFWQQPSKRPTEDGMVVVDDTIYLVSGKSCVLLDAANGEPTREISLPDEVTASWSIIRVSGDYLVGACGSSVVCMNRHTGELVWQHKREKRIGSLAVGGGKVFCANAVQKRRNETPPDAFIEALDVKTGKVVWDTMGGSEIRYFEQGDMLCTSKGMHRASDGTRVGNTPVFLIAGDNLIAGGNNQIALLDPQTGERIGDPLKWNLRGCTRLRGGANVLTTRFMGNAAYLDIATGKITSIWNIRAACANNLFPADGILNVPNLSGGCTCNYMPVSQAFAPAAVVERLVGFPPTEE